MSNHWTYKLLLPPHSVLDIQTLTRILEVVEATGYSARAPTGRKYVISRVVGLKFEELAVDTLEEVAGILSEGAVSLQLWKPDRHEIDYHFSADLSFDWTGSDYSRVVRDFHLDDTVTFGSLSAGVENVYFRGDAEERWEVAHDLREIFKGLCLLLGAVYGYSYDENAWEILLKDSHIHTEVKDQKKVSVLYWLNYFAKEHLAHMGGAETFRSIGCKVENLAMGALVSLVEHPWEVTEELLIATNEKWRNVGS